MTSPTTRALALATSLVALIAAACVADPAAPGPEVYRAALDAPARRAADRARDDVRKPDRVMEFVGIEPGMAVLDVLAGGGYTTEYLSWLVGPKGRVVAFNPPAYDRYERETIAARYADGRLANVTRLTIGLDDLSGTPSMRPDSFDAAVIVQNWHDVYYVQEPDWPKVDGPALIGAIFTALKPGAVLGVVDHRALDGTGTSEAQGKHRIEESAVVADMTAAGFVLEGTSDLLANPADDRSRSVFDPAIRGHTDQMVLRFRKPKR